MQVRITREEPCTGRLDALLSLVELGPHARSLSDTRQHVKSCPRCRNFVETLQAEKKFGQNPTWLRPYANHKTSRVPKTVEAFRKWLEKEVRWRSEQELATLLDKLAGALFRYDPEVRRTHIDVRQYDSKGIQTQDTLTNVLEHLSIATRDNTDAAIRRVIANTAEALSKEVSQDLRNRLIDELLILSHEVAGGRWGRAFYRQAIAEWYGADRGTRVESQLANAEKYATSSHVKSRALSALAVRTVDRDSLGKAVELNSAAILLSPNTPTFLANQFTWLFMLGEERLASTYLNSLTADRRVRLDTIKPSQRIRQQALGLAKKYSISQKRSEKLCSVWLAASASNDGYDYADSGG